MTPDLLSPLMRLQCGRAHDVILRASLIACPLERDADETDCSALDTDPPKQLASDAEWSMSYRIFEVRR